MVVKTKTAIETNGLGVHERLCRARRFIDECYDLPLDLTEISKQACLSRYHFLRLFRDTFDTTPHQYLIHRRIEKAKELLRLRSHFVRETPAKQMFAEVAEIKDPRLVSVKSSFL